MVIARRAFVAVGLVVYAGLHGWAAFSWHTGAMRYCAAFWAAACTVGAFALLRGSFWARRYVLGIGTAGLLNVAAYFARFGDADARSFGLVQGAAFVAMTLALLGKKMRADLDERAPHWRFDHPTMHVLAAARSLNVAGVAMGTST